MKRLFVIGNGFDLAHELPCSYSDFLKYVNLYHHGKFHFIGELFYPSNPSTLWGDFENNLYSSELDDILCKKYLSSCVKYARKHQERNINDFTTFENFLDEIFSDLEELLSKWVVDTLKGNIVECKFELPNDALYLNFNYSNLLEETYQIEGTSICSIHGNLCKNMTDRPIFGHGVLNTQVSDIMVGEESVSIIQALGLCEEDVKNILFNFKHETLRKRVDDYIISNSGFFETICNEKCDEIVILGHSLSPADKGYFEKIAEAATPQTRIKYSYYKDEERENFYQKLSDIFQQTPNIQGGKLEDIVARI